MPSYNLAKPCWLAISVWPWRGMLATGLALFVPVQNARAISGGGKDYASSTLTSSFKGTMGESESLGDMGG